MEKELKKEFDKELREIYGLTLTIQAKVYDLMRKVEETKEKVSQFNAGQSGEYGIEKQSEK